MLKNANLLAKIGTDTATTENERIFAKHLSKKTATTLTPYPPKRNCGLCNVRAAVLSPMSYAATAFRRTACFVIWLSDGCGTSLLRVPPAKHAVFRRGDSVQITSGVPPNQKNQTLYEFGFVLTWKSDVFLSWSLIPLRSPRRLRLSWKIRSRTFLRFSSQMTKFY